MAFPYPFELEAGASHGDLADGAFVAGCLGLLARGLIDIALADDGPVDGPPDGISSLWLKRGVRSELPQPKLETALLDGLAGFQHHAGYRVARTEWASLGLLLAVGRDGWPTRRELAGASLAPYHLVDAVEYVSLGMPELFAALASAAHSLAP